jgi:hypothetical protein
VTSVVDADKATTLVVALFLGAMLAAFLLPVAIGAIAGPEETTATQDVNETTTLGAGINVTVTSVTSGTSATYTVEAGGDSVTGETVNVGSNSTVTVDGADVTISPTNVTSTQATTDYEYPTTYGWGSGAGAIWGILPVIIVLAIFLYFVARAVSEV